MKGCYVYLISSLPMLHFGSRPPFSFERFIQTCRDLLPQADIKVLEASSIYGEYDYNTDQPSLKNWQEFDTVLRNELVKIRAARKHIEPTAYLRREGYAPPYITYIAMNAHRATSILEAERMLDQERWRALEDISIGHFFDLDLLVVYAHKLLILQRWERIRSRDRSAALEEAIAGN
jgi:hypothetical protein